MRSIVTLFVIGILFIFGIQPGFASVSAQDAPVETPALDPVESPFIDVHTAGDQLLTAIYGIVLGGVGTFAAGGLVTTSTAFLKRLPFLQGVRADTISFALSTVIWGGGAVASYFGFQADFKRIIDFLIILIPAAVGLIGTPVASSYFHEQAAKMNGGGGYIGYKRSPEPATIEAIPASALASYQPIVTTIDEDALVEKVMARFGAYLDAAGFNWTPPKDNAVG